MRFRVLRLVLVSLTITVTALAGSALEANYIRLYAVRQGDKVFLDPRAFRAEFDALDLNNSAYAAGRALNSSFDCYAVPQDGRIGVTLGDLVIRKCEAADSVPLPNLATALGIDYDGDRKADPALVLNGVWHVWPSAFGYAHIPEIDLGLCGSTFLAGDLDGDGRPDAAMSAGNAWTVWLSAAGYAKSGPYYLELPGEPVLGDFDGDCKADPASVDAGILYVCLSAQNYNRVQLALGLFGLPVTGDFDRDGKADLILVADVWWQVFYSSRNWAGPETYNFGTCGLPAIADFDGDARDDIAVYNSSDGWRVWMSGAGYAPSGPFALSAAPHPIVQALVLAQSNQTVALVDVSDGKDAVRDAVVSVNGTRLDFGLPLDATNVLYGFTNFDAAAVYYGELPAITAGVPVQVTAVDRHGAEIYRSALANMPGALHLIVPTNGQILARTGINQVAWTGGDGAQAFSAVYLAQTGDAGGKGALLEVLPAVTNQWRLAGSNLVAGAGIVQVAAMAGDVNALTGEAFVASFTLLQHLDLAEVAVTPEASGVAAPQDITITPVPEVLQIARAYQQTSPVRLFIRENDPLQFEVPGVVTLPFSCIGKFGFVAVMVTDTQGNPIYRTIRGLSPANPYVTIQFAVPENAFIKITSTLYVNVLPGTYTGNPYMRTPAAAVWAEQNLAGERMGYAWVGDPYQPIPNASVWINNVQLRYGMDLSFTNGNLRVSGLTLPVFSASLASIPANTPVAATVRDEDGATLLATTAYTFPAPTQLVWPTNSAPLTTYSPVSMEWTPSSDALAYQATYLGVDDNDQNDDIGLYTTTVAASANAAVIPASALRPGLGCFRVDALSGELAKFENPPEFFSFLLVSSCDDATTYLSPPIYEGLQIAKEYSKKMSGLRFTVREGNPYQIVAPGTVSVTIKLRRYKISVAFVAAVDQNGQVYYSWSKDRFFKRKNKTYTVTFNVQPGTTVVIGTHDASYRGGSYTY